MVAYNAEWLKNHFDLERTVICGIQHPYDDCISRQAVIEYIEGSEAELGHSSENELVCQYFKELPPVASQHKNEDVVKAFQLGLAFGFGEKYEEMDKVIEEVKKAATPQPKMGCWIDNKCSECGKGIEDLISSSEWYENEKPKYCPFCGKEFKEIKT